MNQIKYLIRYFLYLPTTFLYAQTDAYEVNYHFPENKSDSLVFQAQIAYGNTFLNATKNPNPLKIYGKYHSTNTTTDFIAKTNRVNFVVLEKSGFALKKLAESSLPNIWHLYVNDKTVYRLLFHLGSGESFFNLSEISIKHLAIKSGNNKIRINYLAGKPNPISMDSLVIRMEFGEIEIMRLNYARAKEVNAELGVGKLLLDFSKDNLHPSVINVKAGAGSLIVRLPETQENILLKIKNTSLSKIELPKNFKENTTGIYVNKPLENNSVPMITFNIDVTVGKVIFENK
ncbi:MAG: hypothetical protein NZM38_06875 [Cytophagales bacterium]|nr:hypothetical protein [Cytophagales bacterium]MDW8384480.1 hypothetical protein [Flammeovirgaceae bacterium]